MCTVDLGSGDYEGHLSTMNSLSRPRNHINDLSFVTWSVHGQQQYSGRVWCLNDAQLILWGTEYPPTDTITLTPDP